LQKPGHWLTERLSNGALRESLAILSPHILSETVSSDGDFSCLETFLIHLSDYQHISEQQIQNDLSAQYKQWSLVDTQKRSDIFSPFKEEQDPLRSYRHLPGQEIMEWYHCCGMKMPERFMGRPDSISMELEFAIYLKGMLCQQPSNSDSLRIYQFFLQRFLLPDLTRILALDSHAQSFPFYYQLTAVIREYISLGTSHSLSIIQ
ncbi:MAG: hypothetical protein J6I64_07595, partial [Lachnospiraceae bacterium]|nr:hypothetical protein [Lachnospiraceae bacterium]